MSQTARARCLQRCLLIGPRPQGTLPRQQQRLVRRCAVFNPHSGNAARRGSPWTESRCHSTSSTPPSSPADASPAAEGSGQSQSGARSTWIAVGGALAAVGLGAGLVFQYTRTAPIEKKVELQLKLVNDEVFDNRDNLFIFFVDSEEDLRNRRADVERVVNAVADQDIAMKVVTYYYNLPRADDPPGAPSRHNWQGDGPKPLRCGMYKGQRKALITIAPSDEIPVKDVVDFFQPRVHRVPKAQQEMVVKHIPGSDFEKEILDAGSPSHLVLLQMYEDSCFLCFLMRPFINSLAALLKDHNVGITIKRLDIAKNDFPEGCPVARGTPTFVGFTGREHAPTKWSEFRPKDVVERIKKEFPKLPGPLIDQMLVLEELVPERFKLFTQLVMWSVELSKLEVLLASGSSTREGDEDSSFEEEVSKKMLRDMRRVDGIRENIKSLQREVDDVEHDAALMGSIFAEEVLRRERQAGLDFGLIGREGTHH